MNSRMIWRVRGVILCSVLLTFPVWTLAQAGRGKARISGVVTEESGNPIAAANLVIEFLEAGTPTKFEAKSNKKGEWAFIGLGTGNWRITASAEGYIPETLTTYVRQLENNPQISLSLKRAEPEQGLIDEASLKDLEKGNQLFLESKYDEALAIFQEFLTANPQAYQAHFGIADCYRGKGEFDRAIEEYSKILKEAPPDDPKAKEMTAKALAATGDCYLKKQDLASAQDFFKKSIEVSPDNELLAYNVGEIYFSNQKLDESIHYFSLATQIKPEWSEPYFKLGMVYLNKADFEKAKESLRKFLTLEKDTERASSAAGILEQLEKIKK